MNNFNKSMKQNRDAFLKDALESAQKSVAITNKQLKKIDITSSLDPSGIKPRRTTNKEDEFSDKQKENLQKLSDELLKLTAKRQQDEINLMEDGREKKLAQIDHDYAKEIDAIRELENKLRAAQGVNLQNNKKMT